MLTAIVITKNESEMIGDCLVSLQFADEIIVVDTGNTDDTNEIAKLHNARIISSKGTNYSQFRNDGLEASKGDWILYVDADERVTPQLRLEIQEITNSTSSSGVFTIPRKNIYLGKPMQYGGWGGDSVTRLFKRPSLKSWTNPLHERPIFEGSAVFLKNPLVHFSHRDLESMLDKTLKFTNFEAELRFKSHHPLVVPWRFLRVMITEFWHRFINLRAHKDGAEGLIDGIFQVFNSFVIYAKLWEMQIENSRHR